MVSDVRTAGPDGKKLYVTQPKGTLSSAASRTASSGLDEDGQPFRLAPARTEALAAGHEELVFDRLPLFGTGPLIKRVKNHAQAS